MPSAFFGFYHRYAGPHLAFAHYYGVAFGLPFIRGLAVVSLLNLPNFARHAVSYVLAVLPFGMGNMFYLAINSQAAVIAHVFRSVHPHLSRGGCDYVDFCGT